MGQLVRNELRPAAKPHAARRGRSRPSAVRARIRSHKLGQPSENCQLDRLAQSTRDLLNTLAAITERKPGFPIREREGRGAVPFSTAKLQNIRRPRDVVVSAHASPKGTGDRDASDPS
jgi:hypothetical protein